MAAKTCELCGDVWDPWQQAECPTCKRIREADLAEMREARSAALDDSGYADDRDEDLGEADETPTPGRRGPVSVRQTADSVDESANFLSVMVNLVCTLGTIGGVVLIVAGLVGDEGLNVAVLAGGVGAILVWLLLWALGLAFVARLRLAAAEARHR